MAHLTNDEVCRRYVTEILRNGGLQRRATGGTLVATPASLTGEVDELVYRRIRTPQRVPWGPVTLCRYLADRKLFLVNGDGFTDGRATQWQSFLRLELDRVLGTQARRRGGQFAEGSVREDYQVMLVPYAALTAAEVGFDSVRALHITEDTWENIWHAVPDTPEWDDGKGWQPVGNQSTGAWQRVYERTHEGFRFRIFLQQRTVWANPDTGERLRSQPRNFYDLGHHERQRWMDARVNDWFPTGVFQVRDTALDETVEWRQVFRARETNILVTTRGANGMMQRRHRALRNVSVDGDGTLLDPERNPINSTEIPADQMGWAEELHHLGASIFSAVGEDGKRHKFVSAFDEDEPQPLYFLAQLPDRSGATSYDEAIVALRPPLVRAAMEKGRHVYRQGDVFAIETEMTDEQVYALARTRVRRNVTLFDLAGNIHGIIRGSVTEPEPAEGEVSETVPCPCRCGHRRRSGAGPKARRALSIYGTGHTADEVVVGPKGVTYVRGTMHHDPAIETEGRTAEHRPVRMAESNEDEPKWCVAVRNTVPRRKRRPVLADVASVPIEASEETTTEQEREEVTA